MLVESVDLMVAKIYWCRNVLKHYFGFILYTEHGKAFTETLQISFTHIYTWLEKEKIIYDRR